MNGQVSVSKASFSPRGKEWWNFRSCLRSIATTDENPSIRERDSTRDSVKGSFSHSTNLHQNPLNSRAERHQLLSNLPHHVPLGPVLRVHLPSLGPSIPRAMF